jgi:hypothetical protein
MPALSAVRTDLQADHRIVIVENREVYIRMKSMRAAQQMTLSWLIALAALQRNTSAGHIASPGALMTLKNRQRTIECGYSAIEASPFGIWCDLWFLQAARDFGNVAERELPQSFLSGRIPVNLVEGFTLCGIDCIADGACPAWPTVLLLHAVWLAFRQPGRGRGSVLLHAIRFVLNRSIELWLGRRPPGFLDFGINRRRLSVLSAVSRRPSYR